MEKDLSYYDDQVNYALRTGAYQSIPGTDIIRIPVEGKSPSSNRGSIRIGSITELLPFSRGDDRDQVFDITMGISGFLAMRDFNHRQSLFLDAETLQKLRSCDFYMTMRIRDTGFKPSGAVREFFQEFMEFPDAQKEVMGGTYHDELTNDSMNSTDTYGTDAYMDMDKNNTTLSGQNNESNTRYRYLRSFATLGPVLSDSSTAVANLAPVASNPIVTMSPTSGSDELENPILYPYFARTISYSLGKAAALVAYMYKELGVQHLSILHAANDYGRSYLRNVIKVAQQYGIQVHETSYRDEENLLESSLENAMTSLERIPTVYHIGVLTGGRIVDPLLKLYDRGLIGINQTAKNGGQHQRIWFFSGTVRDILDVESNPPERLEDVHRALHGSISVKDDDSQADLEQLESQLLQFREDPIAREYYLSRHVGDSIFANTSNHKTLWEEEMTSERYPHVSNARARSYDGVMALGLAACNAQHDDRLLTTDNLHHNLKNVTFQGASGPVAFLETATRDPANMNYRLINLIMDFDSENIRTRLSDVENVVLSQHDGVIEVITPIVLPDNATTLPPDLAPIHEDQGLVSDGLRIFCWSAAAAVILFSVLCACWTIYRIGRQRVWASQPLFLILFCFGTFTIGLSIIPRTWQEPMSQSQLDLGCMLHMWFVNIGFAITYSSLFTRTRRISMIFRHADSFRRSQIRAKDVIWMPVFLVSINIVLLSFWTYHDPLRWERVVIQEDYFGRVVESHGSCFNWEGGKNGGSLAYLATLALINGTVIFATVIQGYQSRFLPSEYNERFHLTITSCIMLEAVLLGIPLLVVADRNASANMVIGSWIYAICAFAVLLPLFVPKILKEEGFLKGENSDEDFHASLRKSLRKFRVRKETERGSSRFDDNHRGDVSSFLSSQNLTATGVQETLSPLDND